MISKKKIEAYSSLLSTIDYENAGIAPYQLNYLHHLVRNSNYFVEIFACVLNNAILISGKRMEEMQIVDFGSGNGLLGMFAKYCGFKEVIMIDHSIESIDSSKKISELLDIVPDQIIHGGVEVLETLKRQHFDAVVGTDVIEHIYNLDTFLYEVQALNSKVTAIFTTASNNKNFIKRYKIQRIQKKDECTGWNDKHLGTLPAFRTVRKNIITNVLPECSDKDLDMLITHTRGMSEKDIVAACQLFAKEKRKPPLLSHPTNTCDPYTGSWTERLLTNKEYIAIFGKYGMKLTIENGFYNIHHAFAKSLIVKTLNNTIRFFKKNGIYISPFIILSAKAGNKGCN